MHLEDLQPRCAVRGVHPDGLVTVVSVQWFGSEALELTYKTPVGTVANELLYRQDEARIEVVAQGRPWGFDGDGALFRLVSEAQRIRLAHLFDPLLAVHTSVVDPLPHQITGVYDAMLPRQPLRFLLADDPGAGKTIMAGLLIKELIARGDLERCLIVCPGSLAEQWQDELYRRFQLPFEILTNDKLDAARTRNWFLETDLVIARLDKLSRDEDVQQKLQAPEAGWDLVVCDEAHKLSATFFGGEIKYTKRYRLGQLLSGVTRHFLLMTATPHNGKEEDFQLFMALLDGDRFEGRFRDGVHAADVSDLMRRMVKERLLKFDGKPLFPERIAYTVPYRLSDPEARLYRAVTDYVREEFNRAEALANAKRAGTVGFALTLLQRRLASSPEAIYQSLRRRRERLETRLREFEVLQRGGQHTPAIVFSAPDLDAADVEDLDEAPEQEIEDVEARILDQATAARSIAELKAEIETLKVLEATALGVRRTAGDTKWRELAGLLGEIFTATGRDARTGEPAKRAGDGAIPRPVPSPQQKLVVFTEHRDTLSYLYERITTLLGRETSVVVIHGSVGREARLAVQESFRHDPQVQVLLATDAAGEGINLQRAHLMVNYDLPWNPNRLEQRFGRIHRIGQTEVCHLWNLVADETREGDVYLAGLALENAPYARPDPALQLGAPLAMEHVRRLPDVLDHVDDVEYHSDVHAVGGGARFHQVELRLGAVDEHDPALDVLGVLVLGFQRRLGDDLPGLAFEARPDPFGHRAGPHGRGLGPGLGYRLSWHQALQELLRTPHQRRGRVDGGHRRHALGVLLLPRLQALERGERLPLLPTLLGRPPRRLTQIVAMQHHALAVEGEHDDRPLGGRLALRRTARLVEGVEVLGRASHQLFRLTLGHFGPGTTRQVGCGREPGCPGPPAQIRTCALTHTAPTLGG